MNVPRFPGTPHDEWDTLTLLAATVFLEAEGEPAEGKNAVAWVIRNRADQWKRPITNVILQPWQFSCWNADYLRQATTRLASPGHEVEPCWRAAAGALWRFIPDPSDGSNHYLNVEATKKLRKGRLPKWFDKERVTCVIGRHTFLAL